MLFKITSAQVFGTSGEIATTMLEYALLVKDILVELTVGTLKNPTNKTATKTIKN